jgi:hypothetical protein
MKTVATGTAGTKKGWRFAVWLTLAAFLLQSYVVQTHIHDTTPAAISKAFTTTDHGKLPVDNSPLDCPFCQATLSGAFALSPVVPLLLLSLFGIFFAAPDHSAAASFDTVAHIWRSRAPPQQ